MRPPAHWLQRAAPSVLEDHRPDLIAVALDDRVRAAERLRLFRVERRVYAAVDHHRSTLPGLGTELVAAERIAGVDPQTHDIARLQVVGCAVANGTPVISRAVQEPGGAVVTGPRFKVHNVRSGHQRGCSFDDMVDLANPVV
jgi:hypothetical protein